MEAAVSLGASVSWRGYRRRVEPPHVRLMHPAAGPRVVLDAKPVAAHLENGDDLAFPERTGGVGRGGGGVDERGPPADDGGGRPGEGGRERYGGGGDSQHQRRPSDPEARARP